MQEEIPDDKEEVYMKKVVDTFQYVNIPNITNAYVSNVSSDGKQFTIATRWSQKNYELSKSDEFSVLYSFDKCGNHLNRISPPLESTKVSLEAISPSLKQRAVIKKHVKEDASTKDVYVLEIWSNKQRMKTIDLSSFDKHGKVHSDALFGSLCWSQDESKLVYIAEKKQPKTSGYFERVSGNSGTEKKPLQGEKYDYEESWGELLSDVKNTVLCIFTLSDDSLKIVEGIPDNLCPLQPEFGPNNTMVFSAFDKLPFRLGAIYCENRACGMYLVHLEDGKCAVELTKSDKITANYHAHLNKGETKFAFFQRQLSGFGDPHRGAVSLMTYSFNEGNTKILCNELKHGDKMFSLFVLGKNVKYNVWLPDDIHIAIPNTVEGRNCVCVVDTDSGLLKSMIECSQVLGMYNRFFLASYEKLGSEFSSLMVIDLNDPVNPAVAKEPQTIDNEIESDSLTDEHGLVSFYLIPKVHPGLNTRFPLCVTAHGGPHSTFTNDYNKSARFFCRLGYAVLLVNYRGSTSFTDDSLKSLPGHVGTQDVCDVQNIVNKFICLKENLLDKENIFVTGGSHGGFLMAHLIGQYPDFYKAACLRNPVIEISSMSTSSDIPDWTYFESGLHYTQDTIISSDAATSMLSKSPVVHLAKIKAPVLLCIGGKDARVPPDQGKYFFRLLKGNKKVVKMLFYPDDSHPLSTVETDGDHFVNMAKWFYQHGTHSK